MIYIETDLGYIMVSLTEEHNMTDQRYTLDRIRSHAEYTRTNCDTISAILVDLSVRSGPMDALTDRRLGQVERLLCDIKVDMKMIEEHAKDIT